MSTGKKCPHCGGSMRCKDSRPSSVPDVLWRRVHECTVCGRRMSTHEIVVGEEGTGASSMEAKVHEFLICVDTIASDIFGEKFRMSAAQIGRRLGNARSVRGRKK